MKIILKILGSHPDLITACAKSFKRFHPEAEIFSEVEGKYPDNLVNIVPPLDNKLNSFLVIKLLSSLKQFKDKCDILVICNESTYFIKDVNNVCNDMVEQNISFSYCGTNSKLNDLSQVAITNNGLFVVRNTDDLIDATVFIDAINENVVEVEEIEDIGNLIISLIDTHNSSRSDLIYDPQLLPATIDSDKFIAVDLLLYSKDGKARNGITVEDYFLDDYMKYVPEGETKNQFAELIHSVHLHSTKESLANLSKKYFIINKYEQVKTTKLKAEAEAHAAEAYEEWIKEHQDEASLNCTDEQK